MRHYGLTPAIKLLLVGQANGETNMAQKISAASENQFLIASYSDQFERVNGYRPLVHYSRGYFYVQSAAGSFKTAYRRGELERAWTALSQRPSA
jgi:hypothetical protein